MPEVLSTRELMNMLPHRFPFLLVDRIDEVVPGEFARGVKCVTINEPFFQGHFPGEPIMPGVLIAEAMSQVAGVVALSQFGDEQGKAVYLLGFDKLRFRKLVRPGDRLELTARKVSERRGVMWVFDVEARVDGKRVANGSLMATLSSVVD